MPEASRRLSVLVVVDGQPALVELAVNAFERRDVVAAGSIALPSGLTLSTGRFPPFRSGPEIRRCSVSS